VGAGVGTGIGSATAADKKDEAMRATAARRANISVCQRGCEVEWRESGGDVQPLGPKAKGFMADDDARGLLIHAG
jgi:hypothetical protein